VAIVVICFITGLKILEYKFLKISLINMKKMKKYPLGKLAATRMALIFCQMILQELKPASPPV
jgi:hypothetical protein